MKKTPEKQGFFRSLNYLGKLIGSCGATPVQPQGGEFESAQGQIDRAASPAARPRLLVLAKHFMHALYLRYRDASCFSRWPHQLNPFSFRNENLDGSAIVSFYGFYQYLLGHGSVLS
jgi:hypothetical protein